MDVMYRWELIVIKVEKHARSWLTRVTHDISSNEHHLASQLSLGKQHSFPLAPLGCFLDLGMRGINEVRSLHIHKFIAVISNV